jgi:sugar O-acyltransferase (sialic acid O-acetyltransferase NeuD family)
MKYYGIVGAGGFGREIMPVVYRQFYQEIKNGAAQLIFVTEEKSDLANVNGHPLVSMEHFQALSGELFFNIAIADSGARERIATECAQHGMAPFQILSENSMLLDSNEIAEGAIFAPFSMVTSNSKIGRFFHANIYSYVAHDCLIGDFVTFAPGVKCNGNIVIEDHAYLGTNAIIKQGTRQNPTVIGRGATIGMGAVVTKSVAPNTTVVGNPARPMPAKSV